MAKKPPAFLFYAKDWLSSPSVRTMSLEAKGAYVQLLATAWDSDPPGTLPDNDEELRLLASASKEEWERVRWSVLSNFKKNNYGGLYNEKMRNQADELRMYRIQKSISGTRGAEEKWGVPIEDRVNKKKRSERLSEARKKGTHTAEEWNFLVYFCGNKCVKCQAFGPLVKDHVLPIYLGGSDSIGNLQPLCVPCNSAKGQESVDYVDRKRLANAWQTPSLHLHSALASASKDLKPGANPAPFSSLPPEQKRQIVRGRIIEHLDYRKEVEDRLKVLARDKRMQS